MQPVFSSSARMSSECSRKYSTPSLPVETLSEGHCSGRGCWFCRASTMLTLSAFQMVAGQSGMFPVKSRASAGAASSVAARCGCGGLGWLLGTRAAAAGRRERTRIVVVASTAFGCGL